jgi:hypothetical protein
VEGAAFAQLELLDLFGELDFHACGPLAAAGLISCRAL